MLLIETKVENFLLPFWDSDLFYHHPVKNQPNWQQNHHLREKLWFWEKKEETQQPKLAKSAERHGCRCEELGGLVSEGWRAQGGAWMLLLSLVDAAQVSSSERWDLQAWRKGDLNAWTQTVSSKHKQEQTKGIKSNNSNIFFVFSPCKTENVQQVEVSESFCIIITFFSHFVFLREARNQIDSASIYMRSFLNLKVIINAKTLQS